MAGGVIGMNPAVNQAESIVGAMNTTAKGAAGAIQQDNAYKLALFQIAQEERERQAAAEGAKLMFDGLSERYGLDVSKDEIPDLLRRPGTGREVDPAVQAKLERARGIATRLPKGQRARFFADFEDHLQKEQEAEFGRGLANSLDLVGPELFGDDELGQERLAKLRDLAEVDPYRAYSHFSDVVETRSKENTDIRERDRVRMRLDAAIEAPEGPPGLPITDENRGAATMLAELALNQGLTGRELRAAEKEVLATLYGLKGGRTFAPDEEDGGGKTLDELLGAGDGGGSDGVRGNGDSVGSGGAGGGDGTAPVKPEHEQLGVTEDTLNRVQEGRGIDSLGAPDSDTVQDFLTHIAQLQAKGATAQEVFEYAATAGIDLTADWPDSYGMALQAIKKRLRKKGGGDKANANAKPGHRDSRSLSGFAGGGPR